MISFRVGPEDAGARLDVALARLADITRTHAQRALKAGAVAVNGEPGRASLRLEIGDEVSGEIPPSEMAPPEARDIPVDIRYSDDDVLVVSKPAGLVTHPARGHEQDTLVNALLGLGVPLSAMGSSRPGIVHRLDKDTSGLLLVAKNDAAQDALVGSLRAWAIERRYLTLIRGRLAAPTGTIEAPIGRHPVRRQLMAVVPGGRDAVTHYREVEVGEDVSLIEARLETGRTHQIRVHLSHIGHPVIGDRVYGGGGDVPKALGLSRFFLHSWRLAFPHPVSGERIEVEAPLPPDLATALARSQLSDPSSG